jgi:SAM-dependent methyltransferase
MSDCNPINKVEAPIACQDNRAIWAYYQNQYAESFAGARPRLDYLLKAIARRSIRNACPQVLNIGAGAGYFEQCAQSRGWGIQALDPDAQTVARLQRLGIAAQCGLIEQMPFPAASFDFVVASEVLEHLADAQRLAGIREVARVLTPGGWFMGTVPYREDLSQGIVACPRCGEVFHRWGHQISFDAPRLRADLQHGFPKVQTRITAYLSFQDRSLHGIVSALARYLLAQLRMPISTTSLLFFAHKARDSAPY